VFDSYTNKYYSFNTTVWKALKFNQGQIMQCVFTYATGVYL